MNILSIKRPSTRTLSTYLLMTSAVCGMLFISACATTPQQEVKVAKEHVWPAAPEQAIIKYQRQFRSEEMFGTEKKSDWKDALLGKIDENFVSLRTPYGVHADDQGRVFVADTNLRGVAIFDFENEKFSMVGAVEPGKLEQPTSVASDRFGRIYVADGRGQKVAVYDLNGKFLNYLGEGSEFERPVGIVVDNERERVYVADALKHHIAVFDFEGQRISIIGSRGMDPGYFNVPLDLALDNTGQLYVVDSMNFRIQVINPDTEAVVRTIGQQGQALGQFARPKGVTVDSDGNVYVSDAAFANVQMFNSDGELLMVFGKAGTGPGGFSLPAGLASDAQDRIYVADQANLRVQVFQYLGKPVVEATANTDSD